MTVSGPAAKQPQPAPLGGVPAASGLASDWTKKAAPNMQYHPPAKPNGSLPLTAEIVVPIAAAGLTFGLMVAKGYKYPMGGPEWTAGNTWCTLALPGAIGAAAAGFFGARSGTQTLASAVANHKNSKVPALPERQLHTQLPNSRLAIAPADVTGPMNSADKPTLYVEGIDNGAPAGTYSVLRPGGSVTSEDSWTAALSKATHAETATNKPQAILQLQGDSWGVVPVSYGQGSAAQQRFDSYHLTTTDPSIAAVVDNTGLYRVNS